MKRRADRYMITNYILVALIIASLTASGLLIAFVAVPAADAMEQAEPTEQIIEPAAAEPADQVEAEAPAFTAEELSLLALVIYQEAGGDNCSDETRRMVGEVALNRVADSRFPDTLAEVLTQRSQYGRLHWTGLEWPERAQNPGEEHAVLRAYECATAVLMSDERLLPQDVVFQAEFVQGSEVVAYSDGFYFCR